MRKLFRLQGVNAASGQGRLQLLFHPIVAEGETVPLDQALVINLAAEEAANAVTKVGSAFVISLEPVASTTP